MIDPDLECIARIKNGDGQGLDTLMERHIEALHRFIFRYTNNREDAADIAQETFVRVFRKADSYKPKATVKTWVYTIALNLCRDRARRAARVKWIPFLRASEGNDPGFGIEDVVADSHDDPSDAAGVTELENAVAKSIEGLPEKLRVPFVLCVLESHSQAEAARMMNVTPKTIEVRIYRARFHLRDSLEPILRDFGRL